MDAKTPSDVPAAPIPEMPSTSPATSPTTPQSQRRGGLWVALVLALVGGAVAAVGIRDRSVAHAMLQERAQELAVATVDVAPPAKRSGPMLLDLPGRLEAYARAPLFARVSGYVKSWTSDIGARVKAGDVLAEIEAPDLDQQLLQARSDLVTAEANQQIANVTNQRYQSLLPNATVSRQAADEKAADLAAKNAIVRSQQANVARLQSMAQFKQIVAPFDGLVTARNTDVGALINAGNATGNELFVVSDTRTLRLYVSLPQIYTAVVKPGTAAEVSVPERPGKKYKAKIESGSGAIDLATGAMRVQFAVDNTAGELTPGAFASVRLDVADTRDAFGLPASAVIFDEAGIRVATVDDAGVVTFKKIKVARDLGNVVEVSDGVSATDRIIQNPPDDLTEGDRVHVRSPKSAAENITKK